MDKKRKVRFSGFKKAKIGIPLKIYDRNNIEIKSGDIIDYNKTACIVLYEPQSKKYLAHILSSQWYGEDKYNSNSYGKAYPIPMDNGAKMEITIMNSFD